MAREPFLTSKLQGFGTTIFATMQLLAIEHQAIDLGQGAPRLPTEPRVAQAAIDAIAAGHNQYAVGIGIPALREAIAAHQRRFYRLELDPQDEITVTAGATEAICAAVLSLCESGDEVIVLEPFYDSYLPSIALAGAVPKVVPLREPDFRFDPDELRHAFSAKTRLLILNNPHNPLGRVFDAGELATIRDLCVEHDVIAVSDEVYEHLVYEGEHLPLATLPGMSDRTVTISSAGKTFSCTGWKVGWACASPPLTTALRTAKQFMTYTNATPFQHAIAMGLGLDDAYPVALEGYRRRRGLLMSGLAEAGLGVVRPQGAFFVNADIRPLGYDDDVEFCMMLPVKAGVVGIPCSSFYEDRRRGRHLVRFAFCKSEDDIVEGTRRLAGLRR
ncbi:MAG: N-succinyldiaminopimelate aminotransferase [Actinomycetota bacterium]|jgi:N-succinyldiaminopimelate aminotransferase|nr:N-succinyldiaminopimelate aminotransferase [Actinomycetota bacterium]